MKGIRLFEGAEIRSEQLYEAGRDKENGTIHLGGEAMQGSVRQMELEPGLRIQQWQISVSKPAQAQITFQHNHDVVFFLGYFFQTPPPLVFTIGNGQPQATRKKPCLLLYTNQKPNTIAFPFACGYNLMKLSFTSDWVFRQLNRKGEGEGTTGNPLRFFRAPALRSLAKGEIVDAQALYTDMDRPTLPIELKLHSYSLVASFYRQAAMPKQQTPPNEYEAILPKVEKRILDSLYTHLPSLAELAGEFHVSFSSLNRHFKARHGETVYDHYLRQKMMLALQLLQEGGQTVNGVAFRLGYESVTHFIAMFKKIHGYSPGRMKGG